MSAVKIQLRRKGVLTLPVSLRRKYDLDENDVFTLEDLGNGSFLLVPQASNVAVKTLARLEWYAREVLPLFLIGSLIRIRHFISALPLGTRRRLPVTA